MVKGSVIVPQLCVKSARIAATGTLVAATAALAATPAAAAVAGLSHPLVWPILPIVLTGLFCGFVALRGYRDFAALAGVFLLGSMGQWMLVQDQYFPALKLTPLSLRVVFGLAALGLQAAVTIWVLLPDIRVGLQRRIGWGGGLRLVVLMGVLALFAVSPTLYVAYDFLPSYAVQIMLWGGLIGLHLLTLGGLLLVPGPDLGLRLPGLIFAALAVAGSLAMGVLAMQAIPHVGDEVPYILQAKLYLQGALTAPAPPEALRPGLEYYLLDIVDGRWIPTTAPGWPILLALGIAAGMPWLVNPLLTGATVLLARSFALRSSGAVAQANLVALLMAFSPWVLAVGGSYMTHSTAVFMAVLAWWCLSCGGFLRHGDARPLSVAWAVAGGLAMGWLFATRQFEGVLIGVLTGLALVAHRPFGWRPILGYALGCIATGAIYLIANFAITGNPLVAPLAAYLEGYWPDTRNAFGFGPDLGPPAKSWGALDFRPGHSPFEGAINTANGLASLNREALGWATGSFLAAGLALTWGNWRRITRFDLFLGLVLLGTIGGMFFYWFTGTFFVGPRYWYIACLPVFWISACGLTAFMSRAPEETAKRAGSVIWALCLSALMVFLPWRGAEKYHQYRENYAGLEALHEAGRFGHDLVFVTTPGDIGPALVLNDPMLPPGKPIYLKDMGEAQNAAAAAALPDRGVRHVTLSPDGAREHPATEN